MSQARGTVLSRFLRYVQLFGPQAQKLSKAKWDATFKEFYVDDRANLEAVMIRELIRLMSEEEDHKAQACAPGKSKTQGSGKKAGGGKEKEKQERKEEAEGSAALDFEAQLELLREDQETEHSKSMTRERLEAKQFGMGQLQQDGVVGEMVERVAKLPRVPKRRQGDLRDMLWDLPGLAVAVTPGSCLDELLVAQLEYVLSRKVTVALAHTLTGKKRQCSFVELWREVLTNKDFAGKRGVQLDRLDKRNVLAEGRALGWVVEHARIARLRALECDEGDAMRIGQQMRLCVCRRPDPRQAGRSHLRGAESQTPGTGSCWLLCGGDARPEGGGHQAVPGNAAQFVPTNSSVGTTWL